MSKENKPITVSYSAVSTFKECPKKYYLGKQYSTKLQSSAFSFGAAVEDGCMAALQGAPIEKALQLFKKNWHTKPANKFEGSKVLFDNELVFYYKNDLDTDLLSKYDIKLVERWAEKYKVKDWEAYLKVQLKHMDDGTTIVNKQFFNRIAWLCCRRRGLLLVRAFQEQIMPSITEVISIQKDVVIKNSDGDRSLGIIDLIVKLKGYDEPVILDLKTAGRLYDMHQLDSSDQLRIYSAAENIPMVGYAVLMKDIQQKKSCDNCGHVRVNFRLTNCPECTDGKYTKIQFFVKTQLITKRLEADDVDSVLNDFSEVVVAIKNGVSWKNPSSCSNYGTRCEYYDHCWKRKKLEEIPNLKKKGK